MTPTTQEKTYIHEWLWVQSLTGEISGFLLVNAHRFNTVTPDEVRAKIEHLKGRLDQFEHLYREQHGDTLINFER